MLLAGSSGFALPFYPKPAFATTITSSSLQFYGPALERFLITDSSQTNACNTITVHVKAARGSTSLAENDVTLYNIGTSGQFEMFVTTSNFPFEPANPTYDAAYCAGQGDNPFIVRINQSPILNTTTPVHEVGLTISPTSVSLKDGDTITVLYGGQTLTVNFAKATVTATTDRQVTGVGDGGIVIVRLTDANAVLDPTSIDTINSNTANPHPPAQDSPLTVTGGTMNYTGAKFIEEGQNAGIFDLPVKVISGAQGAGNPNPVNGATLSGVTFPGSVNFQLQGMQVYNQTLAKLVSASTASPGTWATAPYNFEVPNAGVTPSASVVTQNTDGAVSATASLAAGLAVTITDQDQNFDTQSKDFLPAGSVSITMDGLAAARGTPNNLWNSTGTNANVFQETGSNTGIFQPTLTNNAIPITLVPAGQERIDQTGIYVSPSFIAQNNNIYVTYTDPASVPNGSKVFQSVVTLSHAVGSISTTTPTVSLNGKFPLTITDPDLNTNKNTIVSFTATFNAAGSSSNTNANQCWNNVQGCLTLKVGGTGITFSNANPLSITFVETAANTGVFTASNVDMGIIQQNANAYGQTVSDGTQVEFKYHDLDENPVVESTATITIGTPTVNVTLDRSVIPNPTVGFPITLDVTVTDPALIQNPLIVESAMLGYSSPSSSNNLQVSIVKNDGTTLAGTVGGLTELVSGVPRLAPQQFVEAGPGTGVFVHQYQIDSSGTASTAGLEGATVKFTYTAANGSESNGSLTIKSYNGTVVATPGIVRNGDLVAITISDPDLIRDNTVIEQASVTLKATNPPVGNPVIVSDLMETSPGSGVFTKTIQVGTDIQVDDLSHNLFASKLEVHYTDALTSNLSTNIDRSVHLNVVYSHRPVSMIVDRDIIPNPADGLGPVKFVVSITDDALITNPTSMQSWLLPGGGPSGVSLSAKVTEKDGTTPVPGTIGGLTSSGGAAPTLIPQTFTETAAGTGVFTFQYVLFGYTGAISDLYNAKITFNYTSPSGVSKIVSVTMKSSDGSIATDKTAVKTGDVLTVTVTDPDLIRDNTVLNTAPFVALARDDNIGGNLFFTATETALGSPVFTKTLTIGKDIKVTDLVNNLFATKIAFHYTDVVAADLSVNVDREVDVQVPSTTGTISVVPSVVGTNTAKVSILVNDRDLVSNAYGIDTVNSYGYQYQYLGVTSNATNALGVFSGIQGVETGSNTGIFNTTLMLSLAASPATDGQFTTTGPVVFGTILPGDVLTIQYFDQKNATGGASIQSLFVPVASILSHSAPHLKLIDRIIGGPATAANFTLRLNGVPVANNTVTEVSTGQSQFITQDVNPQSLLSMYNTNFSGDCQSNQEVFVGRVVPGANLECTVSNTFILYNSSALISTDRTVIPNPADGLGPVKFTLTIRDNALNTNHDAVDSVLIGPSSPSSKNRLQLNATDRLGVPLTGTIGGLTVSSNTGPVLLPEIYNETGKNTGIFTFRYTLDNSGTATFAQLDRATLRFTYTAANGTVFSASIKLITHDGIITASSPVVKNGDNITVTVQDGDLTRDNTVLNTAQFTDLTRDDQIGGPLTFTATETGLATGTFTRSLEIGKDIKVSDTLNNLFATQIAFHYNDVMSSEGPNVVREVDVHVATMTGKLSVVPSTANTSTKLSILVHDNDLNSNVTGIDMVGGFYPYLSVTSNATNASVLSSGIQGVETGTNTGVFNTTLQLSLAPSPAADGEFTTTGTIVNGTVLPGDTLIIKYFDQKNATGDPQVQTLLVPIAKPASYALTLYHGNNVVNGSVSADEQLTAAAITNDTSVSKIVFTWTDSTNSPIRNVTVAAASGHANDTFTPSQPGQWIVHANFGNGNVRTVQFNVSFSVLPESPIGSIALTLGSMAALGILLLTKQTRFRRRAS